MRSMMDAMLRVIPLGALWTTLNGCRDTSKLTFNRVYLDFYIYVINYSERFGIYHVDFSDPNRKRTPKNSVNFLKDVIRTRQLPPSA